MKRKISEREFPQLLDGVEVKADDGPLVFLVRGGRRPGALNESEGFELRDDVETLPHFKAGKPPELGE